MKFLLSILFLLLTITLHAQDKKAYLINNRTNVHDTYFTFPQTDFKLIGFGGYHGSEKIEQAELMLLRSLIEHNDLRFYLPETDYSIAHYFNQYLRTGDTLLLKDLVIHYGILVPQERSIATYEKWKSLKKMNDALATDKKLTVVGTDLLVDYKYVSRHILELLPGATFKALEPLKEMVRIDTTSYARGDLSMAHHVLKNLVDDYTIHYEIYHKYLTDVASFNHIMRNITYALDNTSYRNRDLFIFENYRRLSAIHDFNTNKQFMRIGFMHLMKSPEGNQGYPYLFARLIDDGVYTKDQILSTICYYTDSSVLWDELYDDAGNYTGYTTEAGYGIGDYEYEYFKGIDLLKATTLSDMTLYRLNNKKSPYASKSPDLIEVIMKDDPSNGAAVAGMSTLDFIDYALLISGSAASSPIFELDKN